MTCREILPSCSQYPQVEPQAPVLAGNCLYDEQLFDSQGHETIPASEYSTKVIDEVVGRMTSRFENSLRTMVEEEMMEIVLKSIRTGSAGGSPPGSADTVRTGKADADKPLSRLANEGLSKQPIDESQGGSSKVIKPDLNTVDINIDNDAAPDGSGARKVPASSEELAKDDSKSSQESQLRYRSKKVETSSSTGTTQEMGRGQMPLSVSQESLLRSQATMRDTEQKKQNSKWLQLAAFRACKGWETNEDESDTHPDSHTKTRELYDHHAPRHHHHHFSPPPGIAGFIHSNTFDLMVALFITANSFVMAIQLEHQGNKTAEINGYELDTGKWEGADRGFEMLEHIFTIGFVMELCLRIWVNGVTYLKSWGNRLDAAIVLQAVLELYVLDTMGVKGLPNLSFLRLIRIIKLMRVLRIIRVMRVFRQLRILTHAIASSATALLWSLTLLFVIQLISSIFMAQALQPYLRDRDGNDADQKYVYDRFGTFGRSYLTMFELTFAPGAWGGIGRFIIFKVSRLYAAFFVTYCAGISFAIITIIRAIFLKETLASANSDDDLVVSELAHERGKTVAKLKNLFKRLDLDGSGDISFDELNQMLKDPTTQAVFTTLELTIQEARGFFELIDDGDGRLTFDEFMTGVLRLKGGTKSLDLVTALFENKKINDKLHYIQTSVGVLAENILSYRKELLTPPIPSRMPSGI